MAQISESDAQAILKKVLGYSKPTNAASASTATAKANLRFARNAVSTSGSADSLGLNVTVSFGKKVGTATINEFDDASPGEGRPPRRGTRQICA